MNPIRGYTDGIAASYGAATFLTPLAPRPAAPRRAPAMRPAKTEDRGGLLRFLTRISPLKAATGLAACLALAVLI